LKEKLEIKTYLPFRTKREIAEMVVAQNTEWVDGVKKHDSINAYIGFVVAMIGAHTVLEFSSDPVSDYDLLAESGLLPQIIAEFKESYDETDIILKMALAMELEDNNINASVARFLDGILKKLDGVGDVLKGALGNLDLKEILGANFNSEDLANLKGFLDRYNK
jgi:5-formaminoimidazole-4-carboxamide-1-beta-D-ribofuranosyl 5'-monophosphate synthetase